MKLLIILCLSFLGQTALGQQPLTVFLIHGLMGDHTTFCDLKDILEKEFGGKLKVHLLTYQTKNLSLKASDFSKEISIQIVQYFKANNLPWDSPYTFIMHSQGGLVGYKYVSKCLLAKTCTESDQRGSPQNLTQFITLGTPFWGSSKANSFSPKLESIGISNEEIKSMAIGSLGITLNRKIFLKNGFPSQTQVFTVAGEVSSLRDKASYKDFFRYLMPYLAAKNLEFDLVVDVTSAKLDFNYRIEEDNGTITEGETKVSQDHFPIEVAHVSAGPVLGMACLESGKDHPIFHVLRSILGRQFGNSVQSEDITGFIPQTLRNFTVELKAFLPLGYQRRVSFDQSSIEVIAESSLVKTVSIENTFTGRYSSTNDELVTDVQKKFQTYFHTGVVSEELAFHPSTNTPIKQVPIRYFVKVPGFETKKFTLKVSPAQTTYAEILLRPYQPIPAINYDQFASLRSFNYGGRDLFGIAVYNDQVLAIDFNSAAKGFVEVPKAGLNIPEYCYLGKAGMALGVNQNKTYRDFTDDIHFSTLKEGDEFSVIGRYSSLPISRDRYLAVSPKKELFWIEVADTDVIEGKSCPLRR